MEGSLYLLLQQKTTKLMQNYNIQEVKSSKKAVRSKKLYNKKLC